MQLAPMPASLSSFTYFFVFVWVYTACPVIAVKGLHGAHASSGRPHPPQNTAATERLHAEPACHLHARASVALRGCKISAHSGAAAWSDATRSP